MQLLKHLESSRNPQVPVLSKKTEFSTWILRMRALLKKLKVYSICEGSREVLMSSKYPDGFDDWTKKKKRAYITKRKLFRSKQTEAWSVLVQSLGDNFLPLIDNLSPKLTCFELGLQFSAILIRIALPLLAWMLWNNLWNL